MNFVKTIQLLETANVTGSKQQVVIWLLWERGPMSWGDLIKVTVTPPPVQALLAKRLIKSETVFNDRKKQTIYQIRPDVLEYLNNSET
jgi:hypothetical protein